MEVIDKFVDFNKYCETCKYKDLGGAEDPCNECLENPVNIGSVKPVKYEKEEKQNKE